MYFGLIFRIFISRYVNSLVPRSRFCRLPARWIPADFPDPINRASHRVYAATTAARAFFHSGISCPGTSSVSTVSALPGSCVAEIPYRFMRSSAFARALAASASWGDRARAKSFRIFSLILCLFTASMDCIPSFPFRINKGTSKK